jgi:hypothetical protein
MTEIVRLSTIPKGENPTVLGYGPAGSGKSFFAATAGDRMLFINNGAGLETLQGKKVNPLIATVYTDSVQNEAKVYDDIKSIIETALDKMPSEFDTIVIDDSTAFRRSGMHKALEITQSSRGAKSLAVSKKFNTVIPDVNDYQVEMALVESFVSQTCAICKAENKNFIMLAHERLTFNKPTKLGEQPTLIKQTPAFTGVDKSPDYITGQFDWVLHFETVGGGERILYRIRTAGDSILTAKVRRNPFPETIINPNFLEMLKVYRGEK